MLIKKACHYMFEKLYTAMLQDDEDPYETLKYKFKKEESLQKSW